MYGHIVVGKKASLQWPVRSVIYVNYNENSKITWKKTGR